MLFEASTNIHATPTQIFAAYADVENWSAWDSEVEFSSIDGAFQSGTAGTIKPKGAPKSTILFSEVIDNQSFTVDCKLPLCKMTFLHRLDNHGETTHVTHQVQFTGMLAFLFGRLIGKGIAKTLPTSLNGLKDYLEKAA